MTRKQYIQDELIELNSSLADYAPAATYSVPEGYFEGLAAEVLLKIRSFETEPLYVQSLPKQVPYMVPAGYFDNLAARMLLLVKTSSLKAADELQQVSPVLAALPKTMPYQVPAGYFDALAEDAVITAKAGSLAAAEELDAVSPLLSGLKKQMPYSVPAGYFDTVAAPAAAAPKAKVVALGSRKWFRYAAAAVVVGVVAIFSLRFFRTDEPRLGQSMARFDRNMNKAIHSSTDAELNDFLQYSDAGLDGTESARLDNDALSKEEAKKLLNDVSESEMKSFLDETATDTEAGSEISIVN